METDEGMGIKGEVEQCSLAASTIVLRNVIFTYRLHKSFWIIFTPKLAAVPIVNKVVDSI